MMEIFEIEERALLAPKKLTRNKQLYNRARYTDKIFIIIEKE